MDALQATTWITEWKDNRVSQVNQQKISPRKWPEHLQPKHPMHLLLHRTAKTGIKPELWLNLCRIWQKKYKNEINLCYFNINIQDSQTFEFIRNIVRIKLTFFFLIWDTETYVTQLLGYCFIHNILSVFIYGFSS